MNALNKTLVTLGSIGVMAFGGGPITAQEIVASAAPSPVIATRHFKAESTMGMLREQLAIGDNTKWAAVSEKIRAVLDAREKLALEFGGRPPRLPGVPLRLGNTNSATTFKAEAELFNAVLDNAPDSNLAEAMSAVQSAARAENKANQESYAKAQDALRGLVNARQQAQLTLFGILK